MHTLRRAHARAPTLNVAVHTPTLAETLACTCALYILTAPPCAPCRRFAAGRRTRRPFRRRTFAARSAHR
eukprot:6171990-Pleurochrysis_carterae.AAC.2